MAYARSNMEVDTVSRADRVIGQLSRAELFEQRANFRVVHVIVRNAHDDVLLQHIAGGHPRSAGLWGSSAAGYLRSGETYEDAARRKLREELNLDADVTFVGKTSTSDQGCLKFIGVFTAIATTAVHANPMDAQGTEWIPWAELLEMVHEHKRVFTPTFERVLAFLERHPG